MEDKLLARVHSFESFGAVDGPGIRYIIFMQGCHLQCKYCQNRDTWDVSTGTLYSVSDLMKKILKYKNYFIASGGGVTVSGGEPLLQSKFLIELFKELKKENITRSGAGRPAGSESLQFPSYFSLVFFEEAVLMDHCIQK